MRLEPGVVIAQRYRLTRLLGEGGMGVVWAANHTITRRDVAIKLPRDSAGPESSHRFVREARAIAALDHPNVVRVHDAFELADGTPIMVMDLLEGEPFRSVLERHKRLSLAETTRILLPVISAVGTAHAFGIIHRDLKPENVFLTTKAEQSRVRVLDFGIAKLESGAGDQLPTSTGTMLGTPCYMSPEQNFGEKDIDQRVDVWAIGVMLYEALAGVRPVDGDNAGQIAKRILVERIEPIGSLVPGLPLQVKLLIGRMLARDRSDRLHDLREAMIILSCHCDVQVPRFGAPRSQVSPAGSVAPSDSDSEVAPSIPPPRPIGHAPTLRSPASGTGQPTASVVENWESPRGGLAISQPVLGVMLFTYRGHMTIGAVPFIERSVDGVLAAGVCPDLFIDLYEMTGYDSDYRQAVSRWGARTYRRFGEVRVLVRSKIVAMGIAVSNLTAAGKLRPTTRRSEFQTALETSIARHSAQG